MPTGFVGLPGKRDLKMARVSLVTLIDAIPPPGPGGVQKSPGAALVSNIMLRQPAIARAHHQRLVLGRVFLPVPLDPSTTGGGPAIGAGTPPIYLGTAGQLIDRPRMKMAKVFMNVKFGPKTRPC